MNSRPLAISDSVVGRLRARRIVWATCARASGPACFAARIARCAACSLRKSPWSRARAGPGGDEAGLARGVDIREIKRGEQRRQKGTLHMHVDAAAGLFFGAGISPPVAGTGLRREHFGRELWVVAGTEHRGVELAGGDE